MSKTVVITHTYDAAPEKVGQVATDFACFAEAMKGVASFEGMPTEGRVEESMTEDVRVSLFGWMPPMDYHMHVVECDHADLRFRSVEHGGSIKR